MTQTPRVRRRQPTNLTEDARERSRRPAHAGELAVAVARAHGVETMFTLSGAHVFPMYDGAVKAEPPMRLLDVRHEQTAAFAAEATGKLTRTPGLAVLTAGPGVTNGVSADRAGPVRRLADGRRRRPRARRTAGAAAASRSSTSRRSSRRSPSWPAPSTPPATSPTACDEAFTAGRRRRTADRSSSTSRWTSSSTPPPRPMPAVGPRDARRARPRRDRPRSPSCSAGAERPVLILGTDVWADGAEEAALRARRGARASPRSPTAWAAASSPAATRCWSPRPAAQALGGADLVVVVGTPLDFRLGYGVFGGKDEGATPARVVHVADSPGQVSGHADLAGSASGDLTAVLDGLARRRSTGLVRRPDWSAWVDRPPGHGARGGRARRRAARRRGRPDPPGPHLRRAGAPAGRRRGRDRRRRRLRLLRRQVRRAEAARRLARPRPLRLPRRRPRRRDRRPARAARRRRSCCCSATAPPASR